jgi:BirA family biotin operon repressor/biotin-[acetyl-CoA-carboxylase] ligase
MSDPADLGFAATLTTQLQTQFLGRPLYFFPTIDSTNTYTAQLAREGAAEGTVVIADAQSGGKGRLGRSWISPPGVNLYLSALLRPSVLATAAPQLNLLAAVAVADAITEVCTLIPAIKWPNDVLVGGKKVCGILAEMQTDKEALRAVIVGIGVNINAPLSAFPAELHEKASSLFIAGGQPVDRSVFTARLLTHLEQLYVLWIQQGFPAVRPAWERHAADLLGRQIAVDAPEGRVMGTVLGLDEDGALLVRDKPGGSPHRLLAGDVTVVGGYEHGARHDPRC